MRVSKKVRSKMCAKIRFFERTPLRLEKIRKKVACLLTRKNETFFGSFQTVENVAPFRSHYCQELN